MDQMMDIIKKRISIRAYKSKPITKTGVKAILEAAKYAPTARNLQELEYRVITDKGLIERCSEAIAAALKADNIPMKGPPGARPNFFYNAPLLIIITGPKDNSWAITDAGLAAQNIMLYATSIGLGSVFIGMAKFIEKDKKMMKELHISDGRIIAATVICGYADEKPEPREKKQTAEFFE